MLYLVFANSVKLNEFIQSELECETQQCAGHEEVYLKKVRLDVVVVKWCEIAQYASQLLKRSIKCYDANLSVLPYRCKDSIECIDREVIPRYFNELLQYVIHVAKNYDVDFIAITSLPYELDMRVTVFSKDHVTNFMKHVYTLYVRDLEKLIELCSKSRFVAYLMYHLYLLERVLYNYRDSLNPIFNPYVPPVVYIRDGTSLSRILKHKCLTFQQEIASEKDILCVFKLPGNCT